MNENEVFFDKNVLEELAKLANKRKEKMPETKPGEIPESTKDTMTVLAKIIGSYSATLKSTGVEKPLRRALVLDLQQRLLSK